MTVFALPPGADFATAFAEGFHARYGQLPAEQRAETRVLVNSSRAGGLIEAALADTAPAPGPLPRVAPIPELGAGSTLDVPEAIPALRRHLRLTRLVEGFLAAKAAAGERMAPMGAAADLARALADLIDQFHDAGADPARLDQALDQGLDDKAARHWQDTLKFVDLIRDAWPAIQADSEGGRIDPRARQRAVINALTATWLETPPKAPTIAAASTGSVGSTAELMAAIARLPGGALVLPGFDPATDPSIWDTATPDHPMGPFRNVMALLDLTPAAVTPWVETPLTPRRTLLAQALRPAPVTDHWHQAAPDLRATADDACTGLAILEAPSPRHEAAAIATAVREALETPDRTVTIITPDAMLARRITAALDRFGIIPDDIMGQPLEQTPPGILARLVLDVARGTTGPVPVAAMLQHPLVSAGLPRLEHLDIVRAYDRMVLRHTGRSANALHVPDWPEPSPDDKRRDPPKGGVDWLATIQAAIAPLHIALASHAPLGETLKAHRAALEALTARPDAPPEIWEQDAGAAFLAFFDGLARDADAFGYGAVADYPALLSGLLRGETLRTKPKAPHRRVALRGAREARLEAADLTILAGLNDGTWPAAPDAGPWLSRPMHETLGLPLPEREVGLSAHDFMCGAARPEVLLTRSIRAEGAPTVASRWLIRLETLLTGIGAEDVWAAAKARGHRLHAIAEAASRPAAQVPRASRPAPVVPPEARPARLSVTRIETLIRDAYAVYASSVLRLRPMEPLGRPPDARERGNLVHDIMEAFTKTTPTWPGDTAARTLLMDIADTVLAREVPWPDLRRTWRARIERFAGWFIAQEAERRASASPAATERDGKMDMSLPGGPIVISAKADRIDLRPDGQAVVIDYKTGAPPTEKEIDAGWNHQLHVQAAILAEGGFKNLPKATAAAGAYIGLTGSGDGGKATEIPLDPSQITRHMGLVQDLLAAYDTGAPWLSHGRPKFSRHEGDYDHLARKAEWAGDDE